METGLNKNRPSGAECSSRHRCSIYEGPPSQHLSAVAAVARQMLSQNYRCLYLNSRPMVAGMRCYLAAAGVDVVHEIAKASLVMSSDQRHLVRGHFDPDRMMYTLGDALEQALSDGYVGLWASGDMTWELGSDRDFSRLLEYEWRLEEFFREHPQLSGICQYHANTLPYEALCQGLVAHPSLFINETLSVVNPVYSHPKTFAQHVPRNPDVESLIVRLCGTDLTRREDRQ